MNTRIRYLYRDAGNYKQFASVVLGGAITLQEAETITAGLESGEYFIPSQVGLPDLQPNMPSFPDHDADHVWHELDVHSGISLTADPATADLDIHAFAAMFTGRWDITEAMKRLGLPYPTGRRSIPQSGRH
ncbi:MAG: hypothetical protein ABSH47_25380 [Bryobacteraceae bacterium]|jgi:hypothetical protein